MCIFVLNCLTILVLVVLGIFSIRRLVFALTAVFTRIDWGIRIPNSHRPFVTILIPCHNEQSVIAQTIDALLNIEYPKEQLEIVVIDDVSSDDTLKIARAYEKEYSHIHTLERSKVDRIRGKAAALNEALTKFTRGEIVYFIDADHRLKPDALIRLVRHFSDHKVGAVSGRCIPWNKYDSIISSYVYLESLVHHRVTMYASDRLGLAPGILGSNFCILRSLLEKLGCFNEKSLTEDLDLTVRIYEHGYIVKYDVTSITEHEAPDSIKSYISQHLRWNRGFNEVAKSHWRHILNNNRIPFLRRIEVAIFSLGYVDRLFFFAAFGLTLLSLSVFPSFHFPFWVWLFLLGFPAFEILTALLVEREQISMYFQLPLILSMFSLDVFVTLKAVYQGLAKRPNRWNKTPRVGDTPRTSELDAISQGDE